jgi:hypothetical protein
MAKYIKKEGKRLMVFEKDYGKKDAGYKKVEKGDLIGQLRQELNRLFEMILNIAEPMVIQEWIVTDQAVDAEGSIQVIMGAVTYEPVTYELYSSDGDLIEKTDETNTFDDVAPGDYYIVVTDGLGRSMTIEDLTVAPYVAP